MVRKSTRTDSICSHRLDACLADTGITATAKSKPAMKHGADQRKFGMWALLRLKRFSKRCLVIRARYRSIERRCASSRVYGIAHIVLDVRQPERGTGRSEKRREGKEWA